MKKQRTDLKILLLQVRRDQETILEEFYGFVETGKLQPQQITCINPIQQKHIDWKNLLHYDALFVGGSSDVSVLAPEEYPFIAECKQLVADYYHHKLPVFASCFGFQVAAEALGGEVCLDVENKEVGLFEILQTDAAKEDILLHDTPAKFWAVLGHKERAKKLPAGVITLNYTPLCPYHGFKFPDRPFYGFQYHPEMSTKDLHSRIIRYQERYGFHAESTQRLIEESQQETTHANELVAKFIDRILLK